MNKESQGSFVSVWILSTRAESVGSDSGLEQVDELACQRPQTWDGSLARQARHRLLTGKGLLDGVEVRITIRKEQQAGAVCLDQLTRRGGRGEVGLDKG